MWIKSQDKKILVNTNHFYIIDNRIETTNGDILGKYETPQRVEEVLKQIQLRIGTLEQTKISKTVMQVGFYVFEMPE